MISKRVSRDMIKTETFMAVSLSDKSLLTNLFLVRFLNVGELKR
jgi:hypothetical protein